MKNRTIAVDLAKNVFEVGISERPGQLEKACRLSRAKFLKFFVDQPPSTVVMEACGSAHHLKIGPVHSQRSESWGNMQIPVVVSPDPRRSVFEILHPGVRCGIDEFQPEPEIEDRSIRQSQASRSPSRPFDVLVFV